MFNYQYEKEYDRALSSLQVVWREYRSVVDLNEEDVLLSDKRMELEEELDRVQKNYIDVSKKFFTPAPKDV